MPSTQLRQSVLPAAKRVVIKLGTQLLTDASGKIDARYIGRIAAQVVEMRKRGVEVSIVSSGAIRCGCGELGLDQRPRHLAELQAVAAVGQRTLMTRWHDAFAKHDLHVAQLLLTRQDFDNRARFLNFRNCVSCLHEMNCVPIINENDTIAVDELRFGENDLLAALTCNAMRADALVLLSVVNGLLDENGQTIDLVDNIVSAMAHSRSDMSTGGSGGMKAKLEAAGLVTAAGEIAVIANGRDKDVITRLFAGERGIGTVFVPSKKKLDSRSRWIALTKRAAGTITVDDGAARALVKQGKSLLAIGMTKVTGNFDKGALLEVRDAAGDAIARGLTNYAADELRQIAGKRSNQFQKILGRAAYAEVIHRDNLVVIGR